MLELEEDLCVRGESTWIFCARRWYREILSSRFRSSFVASRRSVSNSSILEWVGRLRIELEELILDNLISYRKMTVPLVGSVVYAAELTITSVLLL